MSSTNLFLENDLCAQSWPITKNLTMEEEEKNQTKRVGWMYSKKYKMESNAKQKDI